MNVFIEYWGQVVAEMESRRPCDTDDRRGPSSDRVDVVPTLLPRDDQLGTGRPSRVDGRLFVPRGLGVGFAYGDTNPTVFGTTRLD